MKKTRQGTRGILGGIVLHVFKMMAQIIFYT